MLETNDAYVVVHNHEMAYSIWRDDAPPPPGWVREGFRGAREECLAHIEKVWVDMTPLSLRTQAS